MNWPPFIVPIVAAGFIALLASCDRGRGPADGPIQADGVESRGDVRYLRDELDRRIVMSMTKVELRREFGPPALQGPGAQGHESWIYLALPRPTSQRRPNELSGFEVFWDGDRLVSWLPIFGPAASSSQAEPKPDALPNRDRSSETRSPAADGVGLFIVHDEPFEGSVALDGRIALGPGYASFAPDMLLQRLLRVEERADQSGVNIHTIPEDQARLRQFTTDNLGRRILLVVGTNAITAFRIYGPIEEGRLRMNFPSVEEANRLKDALIPLVP